MILLQIWVRSTWSMLLYDYVATIAARVSPFAGISSLMERTVAMSSSASTRAVLADCSKEETSLQVAAARNKVRKVEVLVYLRKCISAANIRQRHTGTARQRAILQQSYTEL
jgi:hypothetical protein